MRLFTTRSKVYRDLNSSLGREINTLNDILSLNSDIRYFSL